MKGVNFPLFKTKIPHLTERFNLEDPVERRRYFEAKAGPEIVKIRQFLEANSFIAFLLGKKNSGKGTYTKLFMEAVGPERLAHISVGDIVRDVHKSLEDENRKAELVAYLARKYRGFISLDKIEDIILGRDTKTLLPTEVILALVERRIDEVGRKAIFIDGFPRNLDQVSYSLYFRSLIGYRDNPDFFVFIDLPEDIIDERMKGRVVCPTCQSPRNLKVLRTKQIGYDLDSHQFYLKCDNPTCDGARMVGKEGDDLGIEAIRDRLEVDEKVMKTLMELQGVPKIFLRNSIPVEKAAEFVDDYELTPSYGYEWDEASKTVRISEKPWIINDDEDQPSHSLLPAPVTVALIKQIAQVLDL